MRNQSAMTEPKRTQVIARWETTTATIQNMMRMLTLPAGCIFSVGRLNGEELIRRSWLENQRLRVIAQCG